MEAADADELMQMFMAQRDFVDGLGRDEAPTRWLQNAIQPFSKIDLASTIGALHLMPINMERAVRLHRLAHVCAAAAACPGQPAMTLHRLRAIANAEQLNGLATLEDPFENPFTEHFGFNDEDCIVLNGPVESEVFVLGLLLDAISETDGIPDSFRAKVMLAVTSLLRVSTLIAWRAGLTAEMLGEHGNTSLEVPPSTNELRRLQAAVTLAKPDLATRGIDLQTVQQFTTHAGTVDALTCSAEACSFTSPFLDAGDDLIAIQPTAIVFALIQYIVAEGRAAQIDKYLTIGFHEAVVKSVARSLREMKITITSRNEPDCGEMLVRSVLRARIDSDKEISLIIDTDTFGTWSVGETWPCDLPEERSEPFVLHILQSLARPFTHFSDYGEDNLLYSLSAADLETIATVEQRDPLAIWYFVHDTADVLKRTQLSGSTLAVFQLYRRTAHSYYLSDDVVPTFIPLGPHGSGELRLEAQRIRRQHLLYSYAELLPEDTPVLYDSKHLPLGLPQRESDPRLPPFRSVKDAAVSRIADEMGPEIARRRRLQAGALDAERRGDVLNESVAYLFERFETAVAELAPVNLVEALVLQSETLIREVIVHRYSLANRRVHFPDDEALANELREELAVRYRITGALRFTIEYVAARPPEGAARLSVSRFDHLMALAAYMTDFGGMSDAVRYTLADISLSWLPSGRIGRRNTPYPSYSDYLGAFGLDEITRVEGMRQRRRTDDLSSDSIFAALDGGVTAEFGVGIGLLRRFFQALADTALHASRQWMFKGRRDELLMKLLDHGFDLPTADRLISRFALEPREKFLRPPDGFRREDVYPWRADRGYSHRYRPLILRPRDGGVDIVFGARHIANAWRYLVLQLISDRYKATSTALKSAVGGVTKARGDVFNRQVARVVREHESLEVREQVKKISANGRTLRPPGDIDVLVVDRQRRRLIALECKNIEPAHDPYTQWSELRDLVEGEKSIVAKQRGRVAWLRTNVKDVLSWLNIETSERWRVDTAIVTSDRIPGPYLQRVGISVVSLQEVRRMLDASGTLSFDC
jgi:hypothetical protein